MRPHMLIRFASLIVCILAFTALAQAQTAQRTFVSTLGSDANTASLCSAAQPCRSFTAAQGVTTAGGEIIALTSGGYGPVEIVKSLQITAPTGVYVAISAQPATAIGGTDAIRVNAGANDTVVIRGLTLNNVGTANANGITFPSGARLYVENCVINGFDNRGISVDRSGGDPEVFITGTIVRNGGGAFSTTDVGIFLGQSAVGSRIRATINNCQLESAGFVGLLAADNTSVTVRNTVAARNIFGFLAAATSGTTAELNLENCTATLNVSHGIVVGNFSPFTGGAAVARLSNTASLSNILSGIIILPNGTAHISGSTFNGNGEGVDVRTDATAHISTSTINNNVTDGIELGDNATSRVYVATTTISGNGHKGLNRGGALSIAVSTGSNNILNNAGGSDAFSATIAQQ